MTGYVDTRSTWLRLVQFARNESEASVEIGLDQQNKLSFTVSKAMNCENFSSISTTFSSLFLITGRLRIRGGEVTQGTIKRYWAWLTNSRVPCLKLLANLI